MAFVDVPPFYLPYPVRNGTMSIPGVSSLATGGYQHAFVFSAPKTGNISKVAFLTQTVTTGGDIDVRLETVSTTDGNPTGTLWGTGTNATQSILSTDDNTWFTTSLTAAAAVTKGQTLAAVLKLSGTSTPSLLFAGSVVVEGGGNPAFDNAYPTIYNGSWTKFLRSGAFGIEYDDGTYAVIPNNYPVKSLSIASLSASTTPDELALRFQFPLGLRVCGFWAVDQIAQDRDFVLYDSDGTTALGTINYDKDLRGANTLGFLTGLFASSIELAANTYYRLALKGTASSANSYYMGFASAAVMGAMPGGADFHQSSRSDAGAWTDVTTSRPFLGLIVDGLDSGGGGGGGLLSARGFTGGFPG